jgi:hypothetical protein
MLRCPVLHALKLRCKQLFRQELFNLAKIGIQEVDLSALRLKTRLLDKTYVSLQQVKQLNQQLLLHQQLQQIQVKWLQPKHPRLQPPQQQLLLHQHLAPQLPNQPQPNQQRELNQPP